MYIYKFFFTGFQDSRTRNFLNLNFSIQKSYSIKIKKWFIDHISIYFHFNHHWLQHIVEEMVNCVKQAQQSEIEIFYKYIEKCKIFYGSSLAFSYLTATAFMLGPAILPISFPLEAEYPFRVNDSLTTIIIYVHQSLVSYQCSANVCVSIFGALLLWFTVARFECLIVEFQKCSNVDMMIVCIKKQLQLKK